MDIVRLGPVYSTEYKPDVLIEGYSSFIWTERFFEDGEFELKTPLIKSTLDLLPEDTLISHLDTDEVCVVETHSISLDDNDNPELTVTGKSLTSFTKHRHIESTYQKKRRMRRQYSPTGAALVLLWQAFCNDTGADVTRGDTDPDTENILNDYAWNLRDVIDNVVITDSVITDGEGRRWWLEEGNLLPQLENILNKGDLGLRIIRPGEGSTGQVVRVKSGVLADRGDIVRTLTTGIQQLRFDLYEGLDRSESQSVNDVVQFSTLQGDLDRAQYLYSKQDFKTVMEVMSNYAPPDVSRNTTEGNYKGLKRRVSQFDAGDPEIPPEPDRPERPDDLKSDATAAQISAHRDAMDDWRDAMDVWRPKDAKWRNKRDNIITEFKEDATKDSLRELKKARRISMLSGDISPFSPFDYKTHYFLGDKVTLTSDYAPPENVIVSEYVRTEDAQGDRGWPGLTAPE